MATSVNTFGFIPQEQRTMYSTAFDAITQLELWPFMRNFQEGSFMFSSSPEVSRISERISQLGYGGHSGCSFGFTMRAMEYIAKNGINRYEEEYRQQNERQQRERQQRERQQRESQYLAQ
jgi:hypothetical protein